MEPPVAIRRVRIGTGDDARVVRLAEYEIEV
jgi:hypothetical protein